MQSRNFELFGLHLDRSRHKSQHGQDAFVGNILNSRQKGFFVDVGARDGVVNSNTYYLEQFLGWSGILVEPHPDLYSQCLITRMNPVVNRACSDEAGRVDFVKFLEEPLGNSGLLSTFPNRDRLEAINHEVIEVSAEGLTSILDRLNAPRYIDYLDIDTEGHEEGVLRSIDFQRYEFRVVSCEVNPESRRFTAIADLLSKWHYRPVFRLRSDVLFMRY